jgi:Polyketide cyclase / dehydrase and lipid transport
MASGAYGRRLGRSPLVGYPRASMRFGALSLFLLLASASPGAHARGPRPVPERAHFIARRAVRAGLGEAERAALVAGETVSRPMVVEGADGRWVGGVSYQVVSATPGEVMAALGSVRELPRLLPRTKSARLVDAGAHGARVELTQGTSLVEATYTIRLEREGPDELRFELDPSRPHGIDDVWGYVRVRPFGAGKSLVTVAVALDVGPGLVRMLFEDRIQRVILSTPRRMRDYFEPRALARAN